jgi:hypothetical protein
MFAAHCETHQTEVLLTERHITAIRVEDDAVVVSFTCWCGTDGSFADPRLTAASVADLARPPHHVLGRRQLA